MNAAIVTIGDEILIGQIIDSNSAFIAENLNLAGVEITEIRTISDDHDQIIHTLGSLKGNNDVIILTGGLGPTRDDITKKALAEYFESKLVENTDVLDHIRKLFNLRGFKLSESNRLQAVIPDNCTVLRNTEGTAPGMWFEKNNTIFISVPGVPFEMKTILIDEIMPRLSNILNGKIIVNKTISTTGLPESKLAEKVKSWELALPENFKLAYLPSPGIVRMRITATGKNRTELEKLINEEIDKLNEIIPADIYAKEDIGIEYIIHRLLKNHNFTISTAESCTAGSIAALIASIPGSSAVFKGSVVAYSNEVKINELHVSSDFIEKFGAVSEQVAIAMAEGIREKFKTSFSISVTGIAGPEGGTKAKPVGTTWIAIATPQKTISKCFFFGEHRGRNIERSKIAALNLLRKSILEITSRKK